MRHFIFAFLSAFVAATVLAPAAVAQAPEQGSASVELRNFVRDSYIFQFDGSVSPGRSGGRAASLVSQAGGQLGHVYSNTIRGFSATMSSVAADNLFRRNADVVSYTRDGIATIVQASPTRGRPQNPGGGNGGQVKQVIPWGVARVGGAGNGTGKRVWVLDTGVDLDHPDLNVAETDNISFLTKGKDHASPDDFNGHGTHVAGTIAALNNDKDVIGVAAGATVASVRVLDKRGSGSWSGVIAGIDYVAANGNSGDVANMSLGGPKNTAVNDAVEAAAEKGIIFSLAAGNESTNAETRSPASANHANIYTVSAINDSDKFASFSNYGSPVDYAAPGVSVKSLAIGGGISTKSGTSMAAPHVAGILLLGSISPGGPATGDPDDPDDQIATH